MKTAQASVDRIFRARVRQLGWIGVFLFCLVLVVASMEMLVEWRETETTAIESQALYARVLEGQLSGTLDVVASNLRSTGDILASWMSDLDPVLSGRFLADQIQGQAAVRSLSVLDLEGRVLASTTMENVDAKVALSVLGGVPRDGFEQFGPAFMARDLTQLSRGMQQPTGVIGLPLMLLVKRPSQPALLLLAVLNPDLFASQQRILVGDAASRTALLTFDGQLLVIGGDVTLEPGSRPHGLVAFKRFLPAVEHASYIDDQGMDGRPAVGAFRSLRTWPFVIVAEQPYDDIWAQLWSEARWMVATALFCIIGIGLALSLFRKGLIKERAAQLQLASLHAQVAQTEERWKFALEGAGDGVWDWDLVTNVMQHSARVATMLGYQGYEAGVHNRDWRKIIHTADLPRVSAARRAHVEGRSPVLHEEMRMRCKDGSWRLVLVRGMVTPQRDAAGRPVRMTGTLTDISEQRAAETALAASQARRQAVLQSSLDAIVTIDGDCCIVDFNAAAETIFERRCQDVLYRPMHELLLPPGQRRTFLQQLRHYGVAGDSPIVNHRVESEAMRADGTIFPIELTIVAVSADGKQWFTATMRDISERKRVERALYESEARALETFEQAAVGVLQQTAERRFIRVNQTLCRLLQYSRQEFLALSEDELIHPDDVAAGSQAFDRLFAGELATFAQEKRLRRKDGMYVWVRLTASIARDEEGQALYMIGVVEDIEGPKNAQHELDAARKREVQFGARVQQSLLVTPPRSVLPGVWLSSFNHASQDIDGDFFEVIQPGLHCIDLIAGDVMGKGINAALMGAAVKMQFGRSLVELMTAGAPNSAALPTPADILKAVHDAMTPHLQALDAFVTLSYVRIDRAAGTLTWVGCGHEEALLCKADGSSVLLHNQQPPLGVLEHGDFLQNTLAAGEDDTLLMHSDGLSDALLPNGQRVGSALVQQTFIRLANVHRAPGAMLHQLRDELLHSTTLTDDTTILVARICNVNTHSRRLELQPKASAIPMLRGLVEQEARASELDESAGVLFAVAATEAFTNVVRHAVGLVEGAPIEVFVYRSVNQLELELVYIGEAFVPPEELPLTSFDQLPEGGFGLTIIRKTCDDVQYTHRAGVNTTRLTLNLRSERAKQIGLDLI
ncbi:PAS domain S-box protein [Variovorax ginsengisoli]|uniref:histidine kinase n=1 Tax=Variovorax ginsengisoli TaxID=363844 RepID=A0ABT9SFW3_9BURK|nr:PAS domain S-box protein [Variovorax ginsengisoli]MDP9902267.1 PAS domain S-box-containing protein [Variovorax ginsengisoli]